MFFRPRHEEQVGAATKMIDANWHKHQQEMAASAASSDSMEDIDAPMMVTRDDSCETLLVAPKAELEQVRLY